MENLAHAFDQPLQSQEHQDLVATAWMGGAGITVRYWLGRLLRRNLFRESDDLVKEVLQEYLVNIGCKKGAPLVSDDQAWCPVAVLLQHRVETEEGTPLSKNPRLVAAIQAVLSEPALTDRQIAVMAKTTGKQIARMSDVTVLRKLWRLQTASQK